MKGVWVKQLFCCKEVTGIPGRIQEHGRVHLKCCSPCACPDAGETPGVKWDGAALRCGTPLGWKPSRGALLLMRFICKKMECLSLALEIPPANAVLRLKAAWFLFQL